MAATTISTHFDSFPLTLLVGAAKRPYLVHSSLLAANSKTLRAMFEGNWSETQNREVDWSEWEESTVKRYLEWIYTGSYSVSECSENSNTLLAEAGGRTTPEPAVQQSQLDIHRPLTPLSACFVPLPTTGPDDTSHDMGDCSTLSMAHAKLYVLAQYTITPALENAALGRLHKILLHTAPIKDPQTVESVVNLVEYVYANTNAFVNSEDPMRRVISTFCAVRFFELLGQPAFQKLQSEGGDFVVDFWEKAGRLIDWERKKSDEVIEAQGFANKELEVKYASLGRENTALTNDMAELRKKNSELMASQRSISSSPESPNPFQSSTPSVGLFLPGIVTPARRR